MKTLSCKSLGNNACDFVATGETDSEVVDKMMEHAKIVHPGDLTKMSEADMRRKMESEIQNS